MKYYWAKIKEEGMQQEIKTVRAELGQIYVV